MGASIGEVDGIGWPEEERENSKECAALKLNTRILKKRVGDEYSGFKLSGL